VDLCPLFLMPKFGSTANLDNSDCQSAAGCQRAPHRRRNQTGSVVWGRRPRLRATAGRALEADRIASASRSGGRLRPGGPPYWICRAAEPQPNWIGCSVARARPIANRPQVANLPHIGIVAGCEEGSAVIIQSSGAATQTGSGVRLRARGRLPIGRRLPTCPTSEVVG